MNTKKNIICLIICLSFYFQGMAQIAFYDAKLIRDSCIAVGANSFSFKTQNSKKIVTALLKLYLPDNLKNDTTLNADAVISLYVDNPFFGKEIADLIGKASGNLAKNILSKIGSSLGGIPIPNEILLGVTDWIVKRAKQELSLNFFENFKKQIQKYPDLRTVFPETYQSLQILGSEIYNYQRYLKALRLAFQNDMRELTKNLPSIIENHRSFFDARPDITATLKSGFYIADALQDKVNPGDILNDYPAEYLDSLNKNRKGAIQSLQLISASLRDTTQFNRDSVYWVPAMQIKKLIKDKITFKIYLGLVYQQAIVKYDSIHFSTRNGDTTLVDLLNLVGQNYDTAASVYSAYSGFIFHFSDKISKLNKLITDYNNSAQDSATFQLYYNYYNSVLDLFQHSTEISKLPFIKERIPDLADSLKGYFEMAHATGDLFLNVRQHNYSAAIMNTVHIYDLAKIIQTDSNIVKGSLLKYGSFLAAISEADKPEDVQTIIENFALPPGSARVKRLSMFNVSLNAYAGLFIGNEMIRGVDKMQPFKKFNSYGVTAPIGIAISTGKQHAAPFSSMKKFDGRWSHSLFISLVDLGAVASYRFQNDTTAQVPTIKLKDIFSPGLFWSIGIPASPISVNLGAQVGPNLRKIDNNSTMLASEDNGNKTYLRFSVSICVDLPVINFYTKSKQ